MGESLGQGSKNNNNEIQEGCPTKTWPNSIYEIVDFVLVY